MTRPPSRLHSTAHHLAPLALTGLVLLSALASIAPPTQGQGLPGLPADAPATQSIDPERIAAVHETLSLDASLLRGGVGARSSA